MKFQAIADFVISFIELIEAEGRVARRAIMRLGWGLVFLGLAGLLALVAAGFLLAGIYLYFSAQLSPFIAAFIVAGSALLLALLSALLAYRRTR